MLNSSICPHLTAQWIPQAFTSIQSYTHYLGPCTSSLYCHGCQVSSASTSLNKAGDELWRVWIFSFRIHSRFKVIPWCSYLRLVLHDTKKQRLLSLHLNQCVCKAFKPHQSITGLLLTHPNRQNDTNAQTPTAALCGLHILITFIMKCDDPSSGTDWEIPQGFGDGDSINLWSFILWTQSLATGQVKSDWILIAFVVIQ